MYKSKLSIIILTGVFFVAYIVSLHPWFFWGVENLLVFLLLFGLFVAYLVYPSIFGKTSFSCLSFVLLVLCFLNQSRTSNFLGYIYTSLCIVFFLGVLLLQNEYRITLLDNLTKLLSLFLLPSLLCWLLYLMGLNFLPSSYVEFIQSNGEPYTYTNYYLFMVDNRFVDSLVPRFSSVFLEPGHLGMATSLLLAVNGFNLKNKYNLIIFIVTLCTFSLAAYVILFLGKLFQLFVEKRKHRVAILLVFLFLVLGSWFFAAIYNKGDNIVNNYIFSRFELTGDEDIIAGNNRFSADFEQYYDEIFMSSSNKWFGLGNEYGKMVWDGGNSGYKVYIMQYGLIGALLVVLFYFSLLHGRFSWGGFCLICLFLISYLQRGYPLWFCFLLSAILGVQRKYIDDLSK